MKRLALLILILTGSPLTFPLAVQAAPINPVVQYTSTSTLTDARSFTLGYSFTTTSTFDIDALGVWDNGNGDSQQVGLWNSAGTLLLATTVAGGTTPIDDFQWNAVSYLLTPGAYMIGATFNGGDFPDMATGIVTQAGYTYGMDEFSAAVSGLVDPTFTTDGNYGRNGILWADLSATAVPEPSGLMLLGAGLLVAVGPIRRRIKA